MKRQSVTLFLTATIFATSLLGANVYAQVQGANLHSAQATTTESSIIYSNSKMGFSLQIPNAWKDKYEVYEQSTYVAFVHKASKDALKDGEGSLFSIVRYDGKMTGADVESIGKSIKSVSTSPINEVNPIGANEVQSAKWVENNPTIAISNANDTYDVTINDISSESIDKNATINQLMINGGFVPKPEIIVRNNRTLVPIRVVSEILGAKVDWNGNKKEVTISDGDTVIVLNIGNSMATVNGEKRTLDVPPTIENGKTYVPIRFILEVLRANVTYVPRFGGIGAGYERNKNLKPMSVVVIERVQKATKVLSKDDGLTAVKKASKDAYDNTKQYLKDEKRTFDEANKDYDSQEITYKDEVGRYYVYTLKDFDGFNIYFNKYTGEIYSEKDGLPFLNISKGFINISWMYQ